MQRVKTHTIRTQALFCEYVSSNFNAINAHYNFDRSQTRAFKIMKWFYGSSGFVQINSPRINLIAQA